MKKTIIFITLIFLTSCSIDQNNRKEIEVLKEQIKIDTFKKKQECAKMFLEEEKYLEEESIKSESENFKIYYRLDYVFYSPVVNSCIIVFDELMYLSGEYSEWSYGYKDLLTKEVWLYDTQEKGLRSLKIEELKGEN